MSNRIPLLDEDVIIILYPYLEDDLPDICQWKMPLGVMAEINSWRPKWFGRKINMYLQFIWTIPTGITSFSQNNPGPGW